MEDIHIDPKQVDWLYGQLETDKPLGGANSEENTDGTKGGTGQQGNPKQVCVKLWLYNV